ncbi:MAG: DUF3291 domain-containing protein [Hyphomonadaceae bacterium]|nr:DUF3291 domain-containing protein [Hyphomonadaceae bacterium]
MSSHHLAQINIARFRLPQEHAANADFMAALDAVNALAEASPGFVWRLKGEGNSAVDLTPYPDPQIAINMSVWTDLDALASFAYRNSEHRAIMRRRREWFEHMDFHLALWWVRAGHLPSIGEGQAKIDLIARLGPTPEAFTFKQPFPAPGNDRIEPILDECA